MCAFRLKGLRNICAKDRQVAYFISRKHIATTTTMYIAHVHASKFYLDDSQAHLGQHRSTFHGHSLPQQLCTMFNPKFAPRITKHMDSTSAVVWLGGGEGKEIDELHEGRWRIPICKMLAKKENVTIGHW